MCNIFIMYAKQMLISFFESSGSLKQALISLQKKSNNRMFFFQEKHGHDLTFFLHACSMVFPLEEDFP